MRSKILTIMGFLMLLGFLTIGFFVFPVGIPLCAVIGIGYGRWKDDKPFVKWSAVALVIGIVLVIYTLCLIRSM